MSFSQAQSRGRLLRFLVDNLGQEVEAGTAAAGSYIALNSDSELVLSAGDGALGPFTESDGSNAYTTSSINIGSTDTPSYTLDVDGTFRAQGNTYLGDAAADVTTITSQLTASEGANIATGKYLEIGGVSAVSDSGNAIVLGSTATDKTLSLQSDFGTALSIDGGGFLTVPMGFSSSMGTSITGVDRAGAGEWVKVAEASQATNYYATAVIDVMLAGYDTSAEIYQARVHLRAKPGYTSISICQVDIIQDVGSEAWDTSDFILTQQTVGDGDASPFTSQLWVRSPAVYQRCYATITNGSSDGGSAYKADWYLTPEQTWGTYSSAGSDVTTTNVKKRFDSLEIDNALTVAGGTTLGDASSDVTTLTSQLTASEGGYFADRVGIGDSTPGYTLDVNGDANLAEGQTLRIGGVACVNHTTNTVTVGSTVTSKDLNLDVDTGTALAIDSYGNITKPLQPAFFAYRTSSDQSNTLTYAWGTVAFNAERFDVGSDYCYSSCYGTSYAFNAPETGKYYFESQLRLGTIEYWWDYLWMRFNIENGTRYVYGDLYAWQTGGPGEGSVDAPYWTVRCASLVDMTAGEDIKVELIASNGASNTTTWVVNGSSGATDPRSYFTGWLVS